MDGITWKQAKLCGLTKQQFNALDDVDGEKNKKIGTSIWKEVESLLEETKYGCPAKKTNAIRTMVARTLGLEIEQQSETTSANYAKNGEVINRTEGKNDSFVQEGERAIAYLKEHGSLDGFEISDYLVRQGYKVEVELRTLYDDKYNDKAFLRQNDNGDYEVEYVQVSDGTRIIISYYRESEDGESRITHSSVDRSTAGAEERKKELGI